MIRLFTPLNYFNSTKDLNLLNIVHGSKFIDCINPSDKSTIGTLLLEDIYKNFVYYIEYDDDKTNILNTINILSTLVNQQISFCWWLIKDHSCYSCMTIASSDDNKSTGITQSFTRCSNSEGMFPTTTFNGDELQLADKYSNILSKLVTNNNEADRETILDLKGYLYKKPIYIHYSTRNPLDIAINSINKARSEGDVIVKISHYIVALEGLFTTRGENDNLQFKLSYRIPIFIAGTNEEKEQTFDLIRNGYHIRSKAFHGDVLQVKKTDIFYLNNISKSLDELLRNIFITILNEKDKLDVIMNDKIFTDFFHSKFLGKN